MVTVTKVCPKCTTYLDHLVLLVSAVHDVEPVWLAHGHTLLQPGLDVRREKVGIAMVDGNPEDGLDILVGGAAVADVAEGAVRHFGSVITAALHWVKLNYY